MALSDRLAMYKGVVMQLLDSAPTLDTPAAYVDALDRFATWLDNCLDAYRVRRACNASLQCLQTEHWVRQLNDSVAWQTHASAVIHNNVTLIKPNSAQV